MQHNSSHLSMSRAEGGLASLTAATDRSLRAAAAAAGGGQTQTHPHSHSQSRSPMHAAGNSSYAPAQRSSPAPMGMHSQLGGDDADGAVDLDAPLDAPLSADYLARRQQRMHPHQSPVHGHGHGHGHAHHATNGYAYATPQQHHPGGGGGGGGGGLGLGDLVGSGDADYRLEALQLTVNSFKTKMRADFDATFTTLERKSRTQRKELLAHVTASLEEAETRLAGALKTNLNDYQLLEIEFRKNLKMDLYQLRSDMESEMRHQEEVRAEMQRKMKMQESVALELRQKIEELLIGRGGGAAGGPLSPSGSLAWDQQLLSFQHALEALQTKFSLELLGSKKESEMKLIDVGHQILDLRRVVESGLQQDEANQRAQADLLREHAERAAAECQTKVDESLAHMNALLKNLYRNLELQSQNQDVLHGQLSDLQAADNAAAPPSRRRVTQAQLDALEDKLLGAMGLTRNGTAAASAGGAGGGAAVPSAAFRELSNSVEIQSRKLEQMSSHARELAAETDLQTRMALEKFRKEFALATEARLGNLALDNEINKRKLDLLNPDTITSEMEARLGQVEKEASSKLALVREEHERALRNLQNESAGARERFATIERRNDDVSGAVAALEAKFNAMSSAMDARMSSLATEAAAREKKHLADLFEAREKSATDLHALRKEMEEAGAARERRLMDELAAAHARLTSSAEEKHAGLSSRLDGLVGEHGRAVAQLERTVETEVGSASRRLDTELKRLGQSVQEVESKTRRHEEAATKLAEEVARSSEAASAAAAAAAAAAPSSGSLSLQQSEWNALVNNVSSLSLQQKLLGERHEQLAKTLTDSIKEQSALQSSVHSFQRDVERSLHSSKQAELEALQSSQHAAARARSELETALAEVESRVRLEYNELKLKVQDVEHSVKLSKKYASASAAAATAGGGADPLVSPRQMAGAGAGADSLIAGAGSGSGSSSARSDAVALASGGALVKESSFRLFQQQFEELEFKFFHLSQQSASVKLQTEDVVARTDALESALRDSKKAAMARDMLLDEALRNRVEVATFDRFKRDLHATSQSQHHALLSTAQAALAAANQAKHAVSTMTAPPMGDSDAHAASSLSFSSPLTMASRTQPQPSVNEFGRSAASSMSSHGSVSPKSVLRRSAHTSPAHDAGSHRSVRFADGDSSDEEEDRLRSRSSSSSQRAIASAPSSAERSESGALLSLPLVYSPNTSGSLPALQSALERGHTVLKHFALGPPVRKHLFYSPRVLPHASTGVVPVVAPPVAVAGFVYWVEPGTQSAGVLPMATLALAEVQSLYVGAHTKAFLKSSLATGDAIDPDRCFSIWSDERSLEVQTETRAVRDAWVRGLCLLLNKHRVAFQLIGEWDDVSDSENEEEEQQTRQQQQQQQQMADDDDDVSSTGSVQRGDDDDSGGSGIVAAVAAASAARAGAPASKPLNQVHSPVRSEDEDEDAEADKGALDFGEHDLPDSADEDSFDVVRRAGPSAGELRGRGASSGAMAPPSPSSFDRASPMRDHDSRLESSFGTSGDTTDERRVRLAKQREADEQLAKVQAQRRAEEEQMLADRLRREEEELARQARAATEAREAARRAEEEEAARAERFAAQAAELERARLARLAAAEAAERERLAEEQAASARKAQAEAARLQAEQEAEAQRAKIAAALREEELRAEAERSARGKQSRIAEEAAAEHQRKLDAEEHDRALAAASKATAAATSLAELEQRQRAKQDAPMSRLEAVRAAALQKQQEARRKKEEEQERELEQQRQQQQRDDKQQADAAAQAEREAQAERDAEAERDRAAAAKLAEAQRVEAERVAAERVAEEAAEEAARVERDAHAARVEAEQRAEAARLEAEQQRAETERIAKEQADAAAAAARVEAERVEAERIEAERLEAERLETERLEAERKEAERAEAEREEAKRIETERAEAERLEAERVEADRAEAERAEADRVEAERVEMLRLEKLESERLEAERVEAAQAAERARAEEEQREQDRLEQQRRVEEQRLEEQQREEQRRIAEEEATRQAAAVASAAAAAAAESATQSASSSFLESDEPAESEEEEEGEDDDEEEDDKPEWLQPTDHIVQLTLRAQRVPRLGVLSATELVYHISESGIAAPSQSQLHVVDRHHLHGLDEEELEEYALEHPDCLNGIFDIRYPAPAEGGATAAGADPAASSKRLRIRIYDVPKSTLLAKNDNLVGEVHVSLSDLLAAPRNDATEPQSFLPSNNAKPELAQRMREDDTSVALSARMRANARERRAAGLAPMQQMRHQPATESSGLSAAAPAAATSAATPAAAAAPVVAASPAAAVPAAQLSVFGAGVNSNCRDAAAFALVRSQLRSYGVSRFREDMLAAGWFVREDDQVVVSSGEKPFNPFARLVAGKLAAPYGNLLREHGLHSADDRFFLAKNRPELDAAWQSTASDMVGRASMSERHQFLLLRSLRWDTFNVLTLAIDGQPDALEESLRLLADMRDVSRAYTAAAGWSPNLGLFFHCHPLNSVHALHLHLVDLDRTGPSFRHLDHKNLPLSEVMLVLWKELEEKDERRAERMRYLLSDTATTADASASAATAAAVASSASASAGPSSRALAFARAQKAAAAAANNSDDDDDDDDGDVREKGESDDDLSFSFSPAPSPAKHAAAPSAASPAAAAPAPASATGSSNEPAPVVEPAAPATAVGSMLSGGGDDTSDDESADEEEEPSHSRPSAAPAVVQPAASSAAAADEWASIAGNDSMSELFAPSASGGGSSSGDGGGGAQAPAASSSSSGLGAPSRSAMGFSDSDEEDDDDVSSESDDDAGVTALRPLPSMTPLGYTLKSAQAPSSRASGGLAATLLNRKQPSGGVWGAGSSRPGALAGAGRASSNFKIGLKLTEEDEEEEDDVDDDDKQEEEHDSESNRPSPAASASSHPVASPSSLSTGAPASAAPAAPAPAAAATATAFTDDDDSNEFDLSYDAARGPRAPSPSASLLGAGSFAPPIVSPLSPPSRPLIVSAADRDRAALLGVTAAPLDLSVAASRPIASVPMSALREEEEEEEEEEASPARARAPPPAASRLSADDRSHMSLDDELDSMGLDLDVDDDDFSLEA